MDLINGNTHTHLMCLINAVIRNAGGGGRGRTNAVSSSSPAVTAELIQLLGPGLGDFLFKK